MLGALVISSVIQGCCSSSETVHRFSGSLYSRHKHFGMRHLGQDDVDTIHR